MRLTILGKSPSWEDAGGACSGYLIEEGDTTLLLDCGNGVFSKLRHFHDYCDVAAVVISHMHADHILDLIPYAYGLTYSPRQQPVPVDRWNGTDSPASPKLFLPEYGCEIMRRIVETWGTGDLIENSFDVSEYEAKDELEVGPLKVRFKVVPHFCKTHAVEISSKDSGGRLTYGSDHAPNDGIIEFAKETDLLILESTLPRPERDGVRGHLTPEEAGEHARKAGAKRLVLTHISDELDELAMMKRASSSYGRPAEIAHEGAVYEV